MRFRARSDRESAPTRAARERAQRAEHELDEVRRRRPVVDHLADVIGAAITRNHFGESIEAAIALRRET